MIDEATIQSAKDVDINKILDNFNWERGHDNIDQFRDYVNTHHIIGQEFDNVIFSMDRNFRYTAEGRLQGKKHPNPDYIFYKLWYQGVSRAREKLCILIIDNEELFEKILSVKLQFEN